MHFIMFACIQPLWTNRQSLTILLLENEYNRARVIRGNKIQRSACCLVRILQPI